ncbi:hypothetical protein Fmac_028603 [Flemingia macrophylla]|uniref:Uncharacterized protein n=1 Tax=Flemingia macrophylla TaxID=520843 RepID=A0ABD1L7Y9_9FABA
MTTILMSVLLRSNLEWMRILTLMLQTPIMDHHSSRDKALDREDGSQLLARSSSCGYEIHLETRKLEGKLDALVILVTYLAANQKLTSVARVYSIRSSNDHRASQFSARHDAIVIRGVNDVATVTSTETKKLEGKPDALVNLVTQLVANQKPASVARQSGVDENPEAYAANTYNGPPHSRDKALDREDGSQLLASLVQEMMPLSLEEFIMWLRDTSAETRKLEGKLDALVNLVTQLATNQKSASVARGCGIRSSNDHHTSVCPSLQQSEVVENPEAHAANTYNGPPQQQRQGT